MHDLFGSIRGELRALRQEIEKGIESEKEALHSGGAGLQNAFGFGGSLDEYYDMEILFERISDRIVSAKISGLDTFNLEIILYRLQEANAQKPFTGRSLLSFLSKWETEL